MKNKMTLVGPQKNSEINYKPRHRILVLHHLIHCLESLQRVRFMGPRASYGLVQSGDVVEIPADQYATAITKNMNALVFERISAFPRLFVTAGHSAVLSRRNRDKDKNPLEEKITFSRDKQNFQTNIDERRHRSSKICKQTVAVATCQVGVPHRRLQNFRRPPRWRLIATFRRFSQNLL